MGNKQLLAAVALWLSAMAVSVVAPQLQSSVSEVADAGIGASGGAGER